MSTLTAQEIYAQLSQKKLCLFLYNPNDRPIQGRYDSHDYTLPPADECWIKVKRGKVVGEHDEPGVLPIFGYRTEKEKAPKQEKPEFVEITPENIVEHLVGPDGVSGQLGPLGIRRLVGDPKLDEILKADARRTAVQKAYEDDVALTSAHEQMCAVAEAKGKPIPFLSDRVRAAMRRRAKYESGGGADFMKFTCPKCGERAKDELDIRAHVENFHAQQAGKVLEKLGLPVTLAPLGSPVVGDDDDFEPAPIKRGPGRPRKEA